MAEDEQSLYQSALRYHRAEPPGKWAMVATKPMATQRDLSLAYSPGVAAACKLIQEDPQAARDVTARGNLVAVISNGTAVLGLGQIGALASKPVMEGKAVLFKKFARLDCVDIEVDETDPDKFCDVVAALEPSFGAINLEDIKAPDCFVIEKALRERMRIPVFHDDQHGTAIVAAAAVLNALKLVGKEIEAVQLVSTGGGAASLACLDMLCLLGLKREHVFLVDIQGVVYQGRQDDMNPYKSRYARDTDKRTLSDVIAGADVFLGLSAPKVLKPQMVEAMARDPILLAMANPEPEIMPDLARQVRPDAIIATGRSDFPNQVNNVLCFPFIFRGAIDCGATTINEEMKAAAARAIAGLAEEEVPEMVAKAYPSEALEFGRSYILPKPFDPRLIIEVSAAVAQAAMDTGVASRPIADFEAYRQKLATYVFRSGNLMQPVFEKARGDQRRVIFAEGEDERVLRAAQAMLDHKIGIPVLVGRPSVIERRLKILALRVKAADLAIVNPEKDERYDRYWRTYHDVMQRKGVTPDTAKTIVRTNTTAIGALAVALGDADAMVCGSYGRYDFHLRHVVDVLGLADGVAEPSALSVLVMDQGTFFLTDTFISEDPSAENIAATARLAALKVRDFGLEPKAALLSHSSFGTSASASAQKMRQALALLRQRYPDLEVEGEMHGDAAIDESIRARIFPNSRLTGSANLLVMPNLDAANIAYELLKVLGNALPIGPMLLGTAKPAHIVTPSVTARGLLNIAALAAVDAG